MKLLQLPIFLLVVLGLFACNSSTPAPVDDKKESNTTATAPSPSPKNNTLSEAEKATGWELLFDGQNMDKWRQFKQDSLSGWAIQNGEMQALGTGGLNGKGADIISKDTFSNFEFSLDWKISPEGNSGIFFNVIEDEDLNAVYESGPEYQLIDDIGFPQELEDWQKTAANYAMHTAPSAKTNPVGSFNTSKIKVLNGHVEHWLNGEKVVEYDLWTDEWNKMVNTGKWKDFKKYGRSKSGHLALQDHGNMIWFRNLKVRRL